jgi:metal-responsive CopG/Arc/MetJ family transcriptional regulator
MKISISIPDPLFNSVERMAQRLKISLREFFANAAKTYLRQMKNSSVTERLNEIYSTPGNKAILPKEIKTMQASSLQKRF